MLSHLLILHMIPFSLSCALQTPRSYYSSCCAPSQGMLGASKWGEILSIVVRRWKLPALGILIRLTIIFRVETGTNWSSNRRITLCVCVCATPQLGKPPLLGNLVLVCWVCFCSQTPCWGPPTQYWKKPGSARASCKVWKNIVSGSLAEQAYSSHQLGSMGEILL